jgi:CHAT domain-containing protein
LLPQKINLNEIYHNVGSLNLSLGAAAKAIEYFRKVTYQNNKSIRLYNSMGLAFFNLLQLDSTLHYYQKATEAYQALGTNSDPVGYGMVAKNMGDYHAYLKRYDDALGYYQTALLQFYPAFSAEDIHTNPEQFTGVFSYINLFSTLSAKAEAWHSIYLTTKNIFAAQEELKTYQSAFKLIDYVERTYDSDEARLFLTRIKHAVHGKPIDIAFELYNRTNDKNYINDLYHFDQQNKATVLSLNRQLTAELSITASPQLQKEQQIKREITRLSIRAAQVSDSTQLALINNSIRDHEIELGKLQEDLQPKTTIKEGNIPSLSYIQNTFLDNKTALISYHLSEEKLTTLVITKTETTCYQYTLPTGFNEEMEEHILHLKTPFAKITHTKEPAYFKLFLANVPLQKLERLIIIPDDILAYFPFESLQTPEGKYLIQDVAVQYQFSTALLGKNETDFSEAKTLSFAPFANHSFTDTLAQLPNSAQETSDIDGQQFLDSGATKEKFLQYSNAFKIVHLATHAMVNNSEDNLSYIAFAPKGVKQDNLLYAQEIYNLHLQNTGLVILSACETGAGQLVKGEGVLSLSRAFSYAGCPNIITSLWKADDFSTAYLTRRIHRYLKEAYPIAKAVQKAKIDYLNDNTINPRLKQPYYWSHLIFIGNLTTEESFAWGWFIVAGVILLLLLLILMKKPGKARRRLS